MKSVLLFVLSLLSVVRCMLGDIQGLLYVHQDGKDYVACDLTEDPEFTILFALTSTPPTMATSPPAGCHPFFRRSTTPDTHYILTTANLKSYGKPTECALGYDRKAQPATGVPIRVYPTWNHALSKVNFRPTESGRQRIKHASFEPIQGRLDTVGNNYKFTVGETLGTAELCFKDLSTGGSWGSRR